ncbi:hypothetical protein SEVIR_1G354100v4 [Setaria viridis]|uniref:Uncharacterized protein n=1 Tax=Setaria viridis TaxID=4556 RepID=A0A4U6WI85_SETVI|nr:hypothetical protein SEVIR_1G354100v2 [Setaria viridis]
MIWYAGRETRPGAERRVCSRHDRATTTSSCRPRRNHGKSWARGSSVAASHHACPAAARIRTRRQEATRSETAAGGAPCVCGTASCPEDRNSRVMARALTFSGSIAIRMEIPAGSITIGADRRTRLGWDQKW